MAEDPSRGGQPPYDPLPGWPASPADRPGTPDASRPPSAPPPGWTNPRAPWTEPPPPAAAPPAAAGGPGRWAALRNRRNLAVAGGVALLLVVAAVAVALVTSGDGDGSPTTPGRGRSAKAPAAAPGTDIPLLDGRLVLVSRPGWEQLETSPNSGSVRVALTEAGGRELLATFVVTALPGGTLDRLLTLDGGTPFEVTTGGVPLQATAAPGISGRVVAGVVRPNALFFFSLSVSAIDGTELDAPLLQKLFTEQVAPQLKFP